MANLTVDNIRSAFERDLNDSAPEVTSTLFIEVVDYIQQRTYKLGARRDPNRYTLDESYTISSGTASYSLPSGFGHIDADNCGVYDTDNEDNLNIDQPLATRPAGSQQRGYYIDSRNSNLVIVPEPNESDTVILRYIPSLTTLTATTDETIFRDSIDKEYTTRATRAWYEAWKESPLTAFQDQRFLSLLDDYLDNLNAQPYTFENINTSYTY